ncbi:EamA family transporter RarD [Vibrio sp. LaRot3]|uniref:EamA family transporter RarD n=1 Tax=Vibrio sp. LaRot3 TaxID=2998829 RepID=UPI0022CDC3F3|nr:EamA family transporter RarD [Vibrio sp. LaRot3]MDA0147734.1 EamA family transporter RarD [Vibrio sp. LaRot3]
MTESRYGNAMAALSFTLWGLLPLYYQFLPNAAMDELLAMRLIASVPFAALIIWIVKGEKIHFAALFADKRSLAQTFFASLFMCISWTAFTWAMTNDRVIDASLGFFISPLTMAALGVIFLKEQLSNGKRIALTLASLGLTYQVFQYGELPIVALTMAIFFTLYGWFKKKTNYDWARCLLMEAVLLTPFALSYLVYKHTAHGTLAIEADWSTFLLYVGAAPVTLLPLIFYSIAIRLTSMSSIALMQYIEPSIQFLLAVFLFGELFDEVKLVSFSLIWAGLLFTIIEGLRKRAAARS